MKEVGISSAVPSKARGPGACETVNAGTHELMIAHEIHTCLLAFVSPSLVLFSLSLPVSILKRVTVLPPMCPLVTCYATTLQTTDPVF